MRVRSARRASAKVSETKKKKTFLLRAPSLFTLEPSHADGRAARTGRARGSMTKWGEGLRATRSRGGRVWCPPGRERERRVAAMTPRRDRPRRGVLGAAPPDPREPPAREGQPRRGRRTTMRPPALRCCACTAGTAPKAPRPERAATPPRLDARRRNMSRPRLARGAVRSGEREPRRIAGTSSHGSPQQEKHASD